MPTWVGTSVPQFGTASCAPTWPAAYTPTAGHAAVLVVSSGHSTASTVPNTPAGWTQLVTLSGGSGTYGADLGPRRVTVFTRELVGGDTLPAVTQASGSTPAATIGASITIWSKAAGTWAFAATAGEDTTAGTGFSVTGAADPGLTAGDAVLLGYTIRSDAPTTSAEAITATGATFAVTVERADVGTTQGSDHRHVVATTTVSTGTATAAPVVTATLSAAHTGVAAAVRLGDAAAGPVTLDGSGNAAASLGGALDAARPLDATSPAAAHITAGLTAARPVDGSAPAAASATAALTVTRDLAGTSPAAAGGNGTADVTRPLTGNLPAAAGATGAVTADRPMAGSAPVASDAAGALSIAGQVAFAGGIPAAASAMGAAAVARPASGILPAAAEASGVLTATRTFAATASNSAHGTAALTVAGATTPGTMTVISAATASMTGTGD